MYYPYPQPHKPIIPPPQCKCEICQNPAFHHLFATTEIRGRGYILHQNWRVLSTHASISNVHTHGLPHTYTHMDLQVILSPVFGMYGLLEILIEDIVNLIRRGRVFRDGDQLGWPAFSKHNALTFKEVKEDGRDVLRVIVPEMASHPSVDTKELYNLQHTLGDLGDPPMEGEGTQNITIKIERSYR